MQSQEYILPVHAILWQSNERDREGQVLQLGAAGMPFKKKPPVVRRRRCCCCSSQQAEHARRGHALTCRAWPKTCACPKNSDWRSKLTVGGSHGPDWELLSITCTNKYISFVKSKINFDEDAFVEKIGQSVSGAFLFSWIHRDEWKWRFQFNANLMYCLPSSHMCPDILLQCQNRRWVNKLPGMHFWRYFVSSLLRKAKAQIQMGRTSRGNCTNSMRITYRCQYHFTSWCPTGNPRK